MYAVVGSGGQSHTPCPHPSRCGRRGGRQPPRHTQPTGPAAFPAVLLSAAPAVSARRPSSPAAAPDLQSHDNVVALLDDEAVTVALTVHAVARPLVVAAPLGALGRVVGDGVDLDGVLVGRVGALQARLVARLLLDPAGVLRWRHVLDDHRERRAPAVLLLPAPRTALGAGLDALIGTPAA